MTDMTALELAGYVEGAHPFSMSIEVADMLRAQYALIEDLQKALREVPSTQLRYADHIRRQHEAIKVLREDLAALLDDYDAQSISDAKQTLTDTEEFK